MKSIFYLGFAFLLITACTEASVQSTDHIENTDEKEVVVVPTKMMSMEIDGMVCKMGCGGSIRKELKETGAVSKVEFDFEEDRATNNAKIYFDGAKISEKKIIEIVSAINENQFTVGITSTEDFVETTTNETTSLGNNSSDVKIDATAGSVEIPNLLELLADLIVG